MSTTVSPPGQLLKIQAMGQVWRWKEEQDKGFPTPTWGSWQFYGVMERRRQAQGPRKV